MSLAFDEFGRPYIVLREQAQKHRVKGIEAFKANLQAARVISNTMKTSLGPKGMDKMLVSPDQDVLVTNDGATIMEKMEVEHPIAKLLVELSKSQDNEIGDGTTGVVVLAGALLEQALYLIDKGLHPLKIADGYEKACDIALKRLDEISDNLDIMANNHEHLINAAMTSLGSKIVSSIKRKLAEISVKAILGVADLERKDVNFEMIKVSGKTGGSIEDTELIDGIVIEKDFSHPQMPKEVKDAKILILNCPFEPPKPSTKHNINISTGADYRALHQTEQNYFIDEVKRCKDSGANVVMCQWGFDDEGNHLLLQNGLTAVRWVGGVDVELIAIATGGRIVPRFEDISPEKLGKAELVQEVAFGTTTDRLTVIRGCASKKSLTILVRGGNSIIVDEAKRAIHDSLCVVRNLVRDSRVVYGGGAPEIAASIAINNAADSISSVEQYAVRAFADALEQIPLALADNSGLWPIEAVADAKAAQIKLNSPRMGIDCFLVGENDMKKNGVYEGLAAKRQQFQLATQVVKMILKIDDVISPSNYM